MKLRPIILKTSAPAILLGALTASVAAWALTFSPRGARVAATVVAAAPAQAGPGANTTQGTDGLGALVPPEGAKPHPEKLKVPAGFSVAIWADNIKGPRTMTLASDGTVFVGTWQFGNVYALTDRNKDNRADEVITVASGLNTPN